MGFDKKHYEHYWDKGWVVVEDLFNGAAAERVAALAVAVAEKEYAGLKPGYLVDGSENGALAPRKLDNVFIRHELFRDFVLNAKLRKHIESLIGHPPL